MFEKIVKLFFASLVIGVPGFLMYQVHITSDICYPANISHRKMVIEAHEQCRNLDNCWIEPIDILRHNRRIAAQEQCRNET